MSNLLMGDEFDRTVLTAVKCVLDEQDRISGTELASIMGEVGYSQFNEVAAGMFLKRSRAFKRHRNHRGAYWTPTRKYKALLEEYDL